jgi:heat-inducible transcriptional repressor
VGIVITERQQLILRHIVDDYIHDAVPISSESLARNHRHLGVSPATVRNEVAALEEEGYISRPHSSAGSVPDDNAYRLYVESMLAEEERHVPSHQRTAISRRFRKVEDDVDQWGSVAAALIAQIVGNLGIATFPKTSVSRIKHLELVPVQDVLALLIVVLEQAKLRKQLIRFQEPVDNTEIEFMSTRLRSHVTGLTHQEIADQPMSLTPPERQAVDATIVMLQEEDDSAHEEHYVRGLRNLLDQPEFIDYERVRPIIHGIEDGSLIEAALEEAPVGEVVRVVIGQENRGTALRPLSVVICRYGVPGHVLGTIGVIGPTRMEYNRAISGIGFISSIMDGMVRSVYAPGQAHV